ncbi:MAG TPA: ferric reductase-like transmembrane domain-containing protein [Blastocatellia bacterium]
MNARELYGLWALALLLTAMVIGPLIFVLPWLPLRGELAIARRALGVAAFVFASCHVICYLVPTLLRNWHLLYTPGKLWIAGLLLGVPMLVLMGALAFTSSDASVHRLGGHRWKRLHRSVYILLPIAFVHGIFLGTDFGVNKGPDVTGEPDAGSLIGMLVFASAWLTLFLLRRKRIRWAPLRFWRPAGH